MPETSFHPLALCTLATGMLLVALSVDALIRERASSTATAFCALTVPAVIWLFAFAGMYASVSAERALFWAKAAYFGVPFIPLGMYVFTVKVLRLWEKRKGRVIFFAALSAACSLWAVSGNAVFGRLYAYPWGHYPRYEPASVLYVAVFVLISVVGLAEYWIEFRKPHPPVHRARIRHLFVAFCVGYAAFVDFLPKWGIGVYPLGFLGVLGFAGVSAYVLRRHRLVDVSPAAAVHKIMAALGDAVLVLDSEDIVRVANDAACNLLEDKRSRVVGTCVYALDLPFAMEVSAGADRSFEACSPGGERSFRVSESYVRDHVGQASARVVLVREVTHEKRVFEDLVDAENRYLTLYLETPTPVMTLDEFGRIECINAAAERIFGEGLPALTGKIFVMTAAVDTGSVPTVLRAIRDVFAGQNPGPLEITLRSLRGPRLFLGNALPVRRNGRVVAVQLLLRDSAERGAMAG